MEFNNMLMSIEKRYPDIRVINSECESLGYMVDDNSNEIGVINRDGMIKLSKKQIKAIVSELQDVYDLYVR